MDKATVIAMTRPYDFRFGLLASCIRPWRCSCYLRAMCFAIKKSTAFGITQWRHSGLSLWEKELLGGAGAVGLDLERSGCAFWCRVACQPNSNSSRVSHARYAVMSDVCTGVWGTRTWGYELALCMHGRVGDSEPSLECVAESTVLVLTWYHCSGIW